MYFVIDQWDYYRCELLHFCCFWIMQDEHYAEVFELFAKKMYFSDVYLGGFFF